MANSVDPDETGHYERSHLDLHCLQRSLFCRMKGLKDDFYQNLLSTLTCIYPDQLIYCGLFSDEPVPR